MTTETSFGADSAESTEPKWRALDRLQRRAAGVLVEKAKTTPENYPLSLNAITSGCNQKSNRSPQMNVAAEDVEVALDELREMGVVIEIQGGSRVAKYKHLLYDWLGVDKVEMAVMAELLLRGEQTVGELRGRAGRMEPIADLAVLHPVLDSLIQKKLVVSVTPAGRGQIVTHNLYEPQELAKVKERAGSVGGGDERSADSPPAPRAASPVPSSAVSKDQFDELRSEVEELHAEVTRLSNELDDIKALLS
ncbi:MAG: hypothetical protein CMJ64_27600 [Planctomycetaceae bacterium]|nr:hypothetical protein [Planctomycetaceae bacterium]